MTIIPALRRDDGKERESNVPGLRMACEKVPAVYVLASMRYGTLYIGVTSDLCSRVRAHKDGLVAGFTKQYGVKMLVWFEYCGSMEDAIKREKNLKEWRRAWKITLIEETNPQWLDLFAQVCGREYETAS
jgi:putative endonuclease